MAGLEYQMDEGDSSNDEEWDEENADDDQIRCLFCEDYFPSIELAVPHCKNIHNFDFALLMKKFKMDCYAFIKFVNFVRKSTSSAEDILKLEMPPWNCDKYLKPELEYDPWLMFDFEEYLSSSECPSNLADGTTKSYEEQILQLGLRLQEKEEQVSNLTDQLRQMQDFVHKLLHDELDGAQGETSVKCTSSDSAYFDSYSNPGIHYEMLSDDVRTASYKNAIMCNTSDFSNKVVLDLGCGTGILSMFAVSAGAEKVIALDNSDIVSYTMDIIRENRMENQIEVVKSRIEDGNLPADQVDVIISEWMGYFLLFEGMLDSLIYAREHYLKPGGLILPDQCDMFICGANDTEGLHSNSGFWDNVYGYRMSCIQRENMKQVVIDVMAPEKVVTTCACISSFNLYTCTSGDTEFTSSFELIAEEVTTVTTLVGYFDVSFGLKKKVEFSTGPLSTATHWKQTLFHIHEPVSLKKGETLCGTLICERNKKNRRSLLVKIRIDGKQYEYDID